MHGEKRFAEMWRTFKVAQEMRHKVSRVGVSCILGSIVFFSGSMLLPVFEYDNFIDAKHGDGACDGTDEVGLQIGSLCAAKEVRERTDFAMGQEVADLATMLPGSANERVYRRPSVGSYNAVGFEVSTSLGGLEAVPSLFLFSSSSQHFEQDKRQNNYFIAHEIFDYI